MRVGHVGRSYLNSIVGAESHNRMRLAIAVTFTHYAALPALFGLLVVHIRKIDSNHGILGVGLLLLELLIQSVLLSLK